MPKHPLFLLVMLITLSPCWAQDESQEEVDYLFNLNLEELAERNIISASNFSEKLLDAPATVIVLSQKEIAERGYSDVSEIFDDLPGMEVIRPWGDTYFVNYMRGYRYTIGSPYLVMVDGVILNTLYFGITTPLAALPMSNIERIEVVYGPASSVYGANAFMGVINVITNASAGKAGDLDSSVQLSTGSDGFDILDASLNFSGDNWRGQFTARFEHGNLNDRIDNNQVYWLNDSHYDDPALWGEFAQRSSGFSSYVWNKALNLKLADYNSEFAINYLMLDSGYGSVYPGDRIPADGVWPRLQYGAYLKHQRKLSDSVTSRSMVRFRHDGVPPNTFDIEAWNVQNPQADSVMVGGIELSPQQSARMLHLTYWRSRSSSWSIYQDFDYDSGANWRLTSGLKYERKNLQKAYNLSTSVVAPEVVDLNAPSLYPPLATADSINKNSVIWEDFAVYAQGRYLIDDSHILSTGLRLDNNSQFGSELTFRGGYVQHLDNWTVKLLYGEAYQEPVPRSLYGAWEGSGSEPLLQPEQSNTLELSLNYHSIYIDSLLSYYQIRNTETVVNFTGGARNLGSRHVKGIDYHLRWHSGFDDIKLRTWLYFSWLLNQDEQLFDFTTGESIGEQDIGDLAAKKFMFGVTMDFSAQLSTTVRARYIAARDTVASNPIEQLGSYATVDVSLVYKDFLHSQLDLTLKVNNLFDKRYFHPGIRDADAADPYLDPSLFDDIGFDSQQTKQWHGSTGWFNARLPQPGRQLILGLRYRF